LPLIAATGTELVTTTVGNDRSRPGPDCAPHEAHTNKGRKFFNTDPRSHPIFSCLVWHWPTVAFAPTPPTGAIEAKRPLECVDVAYTPGDSHHGSGHSKILNPCRTLVSGNKVMAVLWPLVRAEPCRIRPCSSPSVGISHLLRHSWESSIDASRRSMWRMTTIARPRSSGATF